MALGNILFINLFVLVSMHLYLLPEGNNSKMLFAGCNLSKIILLHLVLNLSLYNLSRDGRATPIILLHELTILFNFLMADQSNVCMALHGSLCDTSGRQTLIFP